MREILFRGKRLDNGKWIEGYYFKHDSVEACFSSDDPKTKHLIAFDGFCDWGFEPPIEAVEVMPETVGQYIGLKDRNGKPIFEGDILDHYHQKDFSNRGVVMWDAQNARFAHELRTMSPAFSLYSPEAWEVVGNIYDNKELI